MEENLEKYDPFKREILFHQNILSNVNELMDNLISNEITFKYTLFQLLFKIIYLLKHSIRVMHIVNSRPQPKFIVFEDPSPKYSKCPRRIGLNQVHLKVVLEKLAKFHASTAVLYDHNRDLFSNHQKPNVSECFKNFHPIFIKSIDQVIKTVGEELWAKKLLPKLHEFKLNVIEKVSDAFILQEDEFGVLCHGDLWMDNLLFQYDDNKMPVDMKMVIL
jgi:hypothetical protein